MPAAKKAAPKKAEPEVPEVEVTRASTTPVPLEEFSVEKGDNVAVVSVNGQSVVFSASDVASAVKKLSVVGYEIH